MPTSSPFYDAIVIGSGVAGLQVVLNLKGHRVLLITKTTLGAGSSQWAQGGVAAAMGKDDSPDLHARIHLWRYKPSAVPLLARGSIMYGTWRSLIMGNLCLGREHSHPDPPR